MNGKDIELSRRRVLGGIATVGAASAAAGAGTFAWFSDTETSENNDISAGTLDLDQTSQVDATTALGSDIAPGESFGLTIETTYSGSIDSAHLSLNAQYEDSGSTESGEYTTELDGQAFAEALLVDTATITINDGTDNEDDLTSGDDITNTPFNEDLNVSDDGDDSSGHGIDASDTLDLEDIIDAIAGTTDYAILNDGDTVTVNIQGTLDEDIGNIAQSDGVSIDLAFGVEQDNQSSYSAPTF